MLAMRGISTSFGDLLDNLQFFECQVMLQLAVEYLNFREDYLCIIGMIHKYFVVLFIVHFDEG